MSNPITPVKASSLALATVNPIRAIVDSLTIVPNPELELIGLSLGDPTTYGNLQVCSVAIESMKLNLDTLKSNGYPPSIGYESSREAVANYYSTRESPLTAKDIIITNGASEGLRIVLTALAEPADNVLLPCPGFPIYQAINTAFGIESRYYNLLPDREWEIDIPSMESLVDSKTRAILINNPSNPCGSVYSKRHLLDILAFAEKYHLVVISDEIYSEMALFGKKTYPIGQLANKVSVLTVGGITKRFLVPGWRLGWIQIHEINTELKDVRKALLNLAQLSLGPNSLVQCALPDMLEKTPKSFFSQTIAQLDDNVRLARELLSNLHGAKALLPQGGMCKKRANVFLEYFASRNYVCSP